MVNTLDSKSGVSNDVPVQVRFAVPKKKARRYDELFSFEHDRVLCCGIDVIKLIVNLCE